MQRAEVPIYTPLVYTYYLVSTTTFRAGAVRLTEFFTSLPRGLDNDVPMYTFNIIIVMYSTICFVLRIIIFEIIIDRYAQRVYRIWGDLL